MPKTLILKSRAPDVRGEPTWHDKAVLENALLTILKGKSALEAPLWFRIAGKVQAAAEAAGYGTKKGEREVGWQNGKPITVDIPHLPDFSVKLGNNDAHQLWTHLEKLPAEQFGNGQMPPGPPGALYWMLTDFAAQLGENYAALDGDEKDEKEKDEG